MPKPIFPYSHQGHTGTAPWVWAWDVPRSKGTGKPYTVSVRRMNDLKEIIWGCDCMAGKNGQPSCQHRMRVQYDLITVEDMLRNLPDYVREIAAPNLKVVQPNMDRASGDRAIRLDEGRRIKVVL